MENRFRRSRPSRRISVRLKNRSIITVLIALAAVDGNAHIDGMVAVTELFGDDDKSQEILNAPDGESIYKLFLNGSETN